MKRLGLFAATLVGCLLALVLVIKFTSTPDASASSSTDNGVSGIVRGTPGEEIQIPENTKGEIDWTLVGAKQELPTATVNAILKKIAGIGGSLSAPDRVTAVYAGLGYNGVTSPKTGKFLGLQNMTLADGEVVDRFQGRPTMVVMYQPTTPWFDWTAAVVDIQSGQVLEQINHNAPSS